jgi:peroxiredoxin
MTVLPMTFAIDAHGRIRATLRGPQTEQSLARALAAVEG